MLAILYIVRFFYFHHCHCTLHTIKFKSIQYFRDFYFKAQSCCRVQFEEVSVLSENVAYTARFFLLSNMNDPPRRDVHLFSYVANPLYFMVIVCIVNEDCDGQDVCLSDDTCGGAV